MSEDLIDSFKATYKTEGKNNLAVQIPYLFKLARLYETKGNENPGQEWTSMLKAHTLYNSCSGRSKDPDKARHYQNRAFQVQNSYNKAQQLPEISAAQLLLLRTAHALQLHAIREKYRRAVKPIHELIENYRTKPEELSSDHNQRIETEFCNQMKSVSIQCTADMARFAEGIIDDAIQLLLTEPPCGLAVIALGSMAREEATPYSDLEFLFLVKDRDDGKERYFENLAMTIYFLIGNLQETTIKYMNIEELKGWFEDISRNGFRIDGLQTKAGNIPTGNGTTNSKNKYICTLEELMARYMVIYYGLLEPTHDTTDTQIAGDEADMLAFMKLIYSYKESGLTIYHGLREKIDKCPPNDYRDCKTRETMKKDFKIYIWNPVVSHYNHNFMMNVKTDFYRNPSLLISSIKMLCNLRSSSSWAIMTEGVSQDNTDSNRTIIHWTRTMLSLALFARLSAYLHYDSQYDLISIYKGSHNNTQSHWYMPRSVLVAYCVNYYALKSIPDFMNIRELKYKAVIHSTISVSDLELAVTCAKQVSTCKSSIYFIICIAFCFHETRMFSDCIALLTCLDLHIGIQEIKNCIHQTQICSLMFGATSRLGLHDQREKWNKRLLELGVDQLSLVQNHYLIHVLYDLKLDDITTMFDTSLIQECAAVESDLSDNLSVASLMLRGELCCIKNHCSEALHHYQQYQDNILRTYGPNTAVAYMSQTVTITHLVQCYHHIGDFHTSLKLVKEALVQEMRLHEKQITADRAKLYKRVSNKYYLCKQYKRAETAAHAALTSYNSLPTTRNRMRQEVPQVYTLLSQIYNGLEDFIKSQAYEQLADKAEIRVVVEALLYSVTTS